LGSFSGGGATPGGAGNRIFGRTGRGVFFSPGRGPGPPFTRVPGFCSGACAGGLQPGGGGPGLLGFRSPGNFDWQGPVRPGVHASTPVGAIGPIFIQTGKNNHVPPNKGTGEKKTKKGGGNPPETGAQGGPSGSRVWWVGAAARFTGACSMFDFRAGVSSAGGWGARRTALRLWAVGNLSKRENFLPEIRGPWPAIGQMGLISLNRQPFRRKKKVSGGPGGGAAGPNGGADTRLGPRPGSIFRRSWGFGDQLQNLKTRRGSFEGDPRGVFRRGGRSGQGAGGRGARFVFLGTDCFRRWGGGGRAASGPCFFRLALTEGAPPGPRRAAGARETPRGFFFRPGGGAAPFAGAVGAETRFFPRRATPPPRSGGCFPLPGATL